MDDATQGAAVLAQQAQSNWGTHKDALIGGCGARRCGIEAGGGAVPGRLQRAWSAQHGADVCSGIGYDAWLFAALAQAAQQRVGVCDGEPARCAVICQSSAGG